MSRRQASNIKISEKCTFKRKPRSVYPIKTKILPVGPTIRYFAPTHPSNRFSKKALRRKESINSVLDIA